MAGLLVICQARLIEQDGLPVRPMLHQAGMDSFAIEGVEFGAANQFQLDLLHRRFTK
jgi:hypothetical protein